MKRYLVEAVGTFFFFLAATLAGMTGNVMPVGLMLMALIYIGAHISGAHYNPALTSAAWFRGVIDTRHAIGYKIAQVLGALLVGVLFFMMTSQYLVIPVQGPLAFAMISEALLAFVFCSLFLVVTTLDRYKNTGLAGLVIGFALIALASLGGTINPAFGACSLICALLKSDMTAAFNSFIVLILGPLVGAVLAAVGFKYLNKNEMRTSSTGTPPYQYQ